MTLKQLDFPAWKLAVDESAKQAAEEIRAMTQYRATHQAQPGNAGIGPRQRHRQGEAMRLTQEEFQALQERRKQHAKVHAIKTVKARNKYGAEKTQVDGITFDSKGEAMRYLELKAMESAGLIRDLCLQVRFPLVIQGAYGSVKREYRADFCYVENGLRVVEDFKGHKTREYLFKRDLMKALHGIEIRETGGRKRSKP